MIPALLTRMSIGSVQVSAKARTDARLARSRLRTSGLPGIRSATPPSLGNVSNGQGDASSGAGQRSRGFSAQPTRCTRDDHSALGEVGEIGGGEACKTSARGHPFSLL